MLGCFSSAVLTSYRGNQTQGIDGTVCFHGRDEMKKSKEQYIFLAAKTKMSDESNLREEGLYFWFTV